MRHCFTPRCKMTRPQVRACLPRFGVVQDALWIRPRSLYMASSRARRAVSAVCCSRTLAKAGRCVSPRASWSASTRSQRWRDASICASASPNEPAETVAVLTICWQRCAKPSVLSVCSPCAGPEDAQGRVDAHRLLLALPLGLRELQLLAPGQVHEVQGRREQVPLGVALLERDDEHRVRARGAVVHRRLREVLALLCALEQLHGGRVARDRHLRGALEVHGAA